MHLQLNPGDDFMHPIMTVLSFSGTDIVKKKSVAAVLLE